MIFLGRAARDLDSIQARRDEKPFRCLMESYKELGR